MNNEPMSRPLPKSDDLFGAAANADVQQLSLLPEEESAQTTHAQGESEPLHTSSVQTPAPFNEESGTDFTDPAAEHTHLQAAALFENSALQNDIADRALLADAEKAPYYTALREQVLATVAYGRQTGQPVEVEAVFKALLAQEFFSLLANATADAEAKAVARAAANSAASPGPLGTGAAPTPQNYADMPTADFERELKRALRGELSGG
ncbi:hypothetical protein LJB77_01475 [Ruminococcaceae bacterium OttesenSCG-928-N02]|nr:hypothetical protein [Ruminococcaceae bacterium OttesenSCG-928-N02]